MASLRRRQNAGNILVTIVIAQRRGDEVLLLGDTMIGNRGQTGPNVLPGRLKVVTIGPRVTVAFAGDADPAGVAIQAARRALRDDGLLAAIEGLKRESSNGQTDFLVASHNPSTSLIRLRKGIVLDINDICALGNDEPFRDLIDQALADNQPSGRPAIGVCSNDTASLTTAKCHRSNCRE
jgi:hypothetical protein